MHRKEIQKAQQGRSLYVIQRCIQLEPPMSISTNLLKLIGGRIKVQLDMHWSPACSLFPEVKRSRKFGTNEKGRPC